MSLKGLLWLISTGKMPAVPAPSGHEGGGVFASVQIALLPAFAAIGNATLAATATDVINLLIVFFPYWIVRILAFFRFQRNRRSCHFA